MRIEQTAAQLYTVRELVKDPAQIAAVLARIRDIGYEAVQVSGLPPVPDDDLAAMLEDADLICCATHEPSDQILADPVSVAARLHALNCHDTAYPYPRDVDFATLDSVKTWAQQLNESGRILHEHGVTLSYHNHQIEFRRVEGALIMDILLTETDPNYLKMELDTYWVQCGGGDPATWCQILSDRMPLLHLKDYQITPDNSPTFAEIGYGNLDWPGIVAAADEAGCRWFIVEQDVCPGDPIESLRASYLYIAENLVE